jgi:hypothetical protein
MIYCGFALILLLKLCTYGGWCTWGVKTLGHQPDRNWRIGIQFGLLCLALGCLGTILFITVIRTLGTSSSLWLRGAMLAVPLAIIRFLEWGWMLGLIIRRGQVQRRQIRPAKWRACLWLSGGVLLEVTSDWILLRICAAC